jgi:hypothetical protein
MKSSYEDLHRLFRESITAREIAEPLAAFDANQSAEKVKSFMDEKGFDVVGVSSDGAMLGYVEKRGIKEGLLRDHTKTFSEALLLDEKTPLLETLGKLADEEFVFLRFLGAPSAIVTRSDLQKAPVRMWLFGLVSILEMQLLKLIKNNSEGDWWRASLADVRIAAAEKIYDERMKKKEDIGLADCLQLCDKREIIFADKGLFEKTGFSSRREWESVMKKTETLRNNLAHSNEINTESWPEKAKLALRIERLIRKVEEA